MTLWGGAGRSGVVWVVCGTIFLSLVPRLLTAGRFWTVDEQNWMRRSSHFADAVTSGALSDASAAEAPGNPELGATMPGVTTMWVGSLGRFLWASGRSLGLWSDSSEEFLDSASALTVTQGVMAMVTTALIVLTTVLVARWAGIGAGLVAGLLMATEPFFVGLGTILHTDALMTGFAVPALVMTALVLGLPEVTRYAWRPRYAALAGVLWGAALLSKLSALPLLVTVVLLFAWAAVREGKRLRADDGSAPGDGAELRAPFPHQLIRLAVIWAGAVVATFVLAYPAMWVSPVGEGRNLLEAVGLAGSTQAHFFLGEVADPPGPLYYFVGLPLRSTGWFLFGLLAAVIMLVSLRRIRQHGAVLACMAFPYLGVITYSSKQADRYGLFVLAVAAIAVGIAATVVMERFGTIARPGKVIVAGVGAAVLAANTLTVAPWGLAYFNPALGGTSTAQQSVRMGWGVGMREAGAIIAAHEAASNDRCDEVVIRAATRIPQAFPCGEAVHIAAAAGVEAQYLVVSVGNRQRGYPVWLERVPLTRDLLGIVRVRGTTYIEVYGPRRDQV
jgi:hypothetical protein